MIALLIGSHKKKVSNIHFIFTSFDYKKAIISEK